jgi:hypothetical protein
VGGLRSLFAPQEKETYRAAPCPAMLTDYVTAKTMIDYDSNFLMLALLEHTMLEGKQKTGQLLALVSHAGIACWMKGKRTVPEFCVYQTEKDT